VQLYRRKYAMSKLHCQMVKSAGLSIGSKNRLEYDPETTSFPATESTRELHRQESLSLKALCGGGAKGG
jgi:hypothetical protein